MKRFSLSILFLTLAFTANTQNIKQYLHKADEFIKDFVSQINLILDPKITYDERVLAKNTVLDDMINSRELTMLYDNISDKEVISNSLTAQNYLDRLFTQFNNQMPLKNPNGNYIKFQFGNFQSDTFYISENKVDKICIINRIINLDSIPIGKQYRSDTISFVVAFKKGDLDDRRILSSFKYVPHNIIEPTQGSDGKLVETILDTQQNIGEAYKKKLDEKQIKLVEKVDEPKSTIELSVDFNLHELQAMEAKSFELSYSNMKFPSNPELVNLETIVFQVNFNPSKAAVVTLKKFIFKDETKINLVDLKKELVIDERVEIITKYIIRLSEQNELQSYLQPNGK
ncbi:MAG: hypothetical protein IPK88_12475 [Saprospiraceae bacterium]|nr:hypothetical protein [Candidatus Defluviibacterium haderslevense]